MTRNLKALGLALLAMSAMTAVMATAAHASETEPKLTATTGSSVILTAEALNTQIFTVALGTVKCTETSIEAKTVNVPATSITVAPKYGGCKAFGVNATVTNTGCNYVFEPKSTNGSTSTVTVTLECTPEGHIYIKPVGVNCDVTVGNQGSVGDVVIHNDQTAAGVDDLTITAEETGPTLVNNIKYTEIPTGAEEAGCKEKGTKTREGGTYTGKATVTGFEDVAGAEGKAVGILID